MFIVTACYYAIVYWRNNEEIDLVELIVGSLAMASLWFMTLPIMVLLSLPIKWRFRKDGNPIKSNPNFGNFLD